MKIAKLCWRRGNEDAFLFGLIGLSAATHWKALVRGVLTVVISFILFAIITYIITMANLFEFT